MKQREIKFRAWDSKEIIYSHNNDLNRKTFQLSWFFQKVDNIDYMNNTNTILMQFTGLLDKNGKEIYEGDIVMSYKDQYEDKPSKNEVKFESGCFKLFCKGLNEIPIFNYSNKDLEVIGNIYENPELIINP